MERTYLVPSDKGQPGRARRLALAASHPAVAAATCGIASMLDTHAAVKRLQASGHGRAPSRGQDRRLNEPATCLLFVREGTRNSWC